MGGKGAQVPGTGSVCAVILEIHCAAISDRPLTSQVMCKDSGSIECIAGYSISQFSNSGPAEGRISMMTDFWE